MSAIAAAVQAILPVDHDEAVAEWADDAHRTKEIPAETMAQCIAVSRTTSQSRMRETRDPDPARAAQAIRAYLEREGLAIVRAADTQWAFEGKRLDVASKSLACAVIDASMGWDETTAVLSPAESDRLRNLVKQTA